MEQLDALVAHLACVLEGGLRDGKVLRLAFLAARGRYFEITGDILRYLVAFPVARGVALSHTRSDRPNPPPPF